MKINHLKLDCANLGEQRHFYTHLFNFKIHRESVDSITLMAGESLLTFTENRLRKPYYHFAFNIPHHQVEKAMKWASDKVDLLHSMSGVIQEFSSWHARSIYFLDPAGNIVELIGRERFEREAPDKFSEECILNVSEVGLPVFEVSSCFKSMHRATGIQKFDCKQPSFCAAGDDEGLFILVDKAEKTWFPTNENAKSYHLQVEFGNEGQDYFLDFFDDEWNIKKLEKEAQE